MTDENLFRNTFLAVTLSLSALLGLMVYWLVKGFFSDDEMTFDREDSTPFNRNISTVDSMSPNASKTWTNELKLYKCYSLSHAVETTKEFLLYHQATLGQLVVRLIIKNVEGLTPDETEMKEAVEKLLQDMNFKYRELSEDGGFSVRISY